MDGREVARASDALRIEGCENVIPGVRRQMLREAHDIDEPAYAPRWAMQRRANEVCDRREKRIVSAGNFGSHCEDGCEAVQLHEAERAGHL